MPLPPGTRLGPYEILALIGVGGMGEVYRARDTRLNRLVALKVAKDEFTERFKQEASLVAQLSHKNICTLHDVGPNFLVMELIDGAPLKGPLPVEKAVEYAGQILDALDHAHRQAITHRDLKPANIMVTKEGIKLLDFGLAKKSTPPKHDDVTMAALTVRGQIAGTPQYMAPEQVRAEDADARSDIFAFGCVLYEMLSGARAFGGNNPASIMAAILEREPEPLKTTPPLDRVIRTCLAKDPDDRFQNARDVKRNLLWAMEETSTTAPSRSRLGKAGWVAAGVLAVIAGVVSFVHFREKPVEQPSYRFQISPPAGKRFTTFRLSPDGRWVAYIASFPEAGFAASGQLWIRALDSLESRIVPGAGEATYPFWSPDSASVGFFANGKMKRVAASGGPAQIVCDVADARGGTWNREGTILFADGPGHPILRVAASGGKPSPLSYALGNFPEFLPDGNHFLYLNIIANAEDSRIFIGSLSGTAPLGIFPDASNATYVQSQTGPDGYVLFRREGLLMAVPFDAGRLRIVGEPFPVAENVGVAANLRYGAFSSAGNEALAYWSGNISSNRELMWMDGTGKSLGAAGKADSYLGADSPKLSPDEKTVAVTVGNLSGYDIWLLDVAGKAFSRFTFGQQDRSPVWSPDGRYLAFSRRIGSGQVSIVRKPAQGGAEEALLGNVANAGPMDWSPDGKAILHYFSGANTGFDLALLPVEGERKDKSWLRTPANELFAVFSPDGRWIAYDSDEAGQRQVYVQSVPISGAKFQISTAGGTRPVWSRDGREIFYLSPNQEIMSAAVKINGASFEAATPQALFTAAGASGFAVTRDGQRFLVNVPAGGEAAATGPSLTVITNWLAALKK